MSDGKQDRDTVCPLRLCGYHEDLDNEYYIGDKCCYGSRCPLWNSKYGGTCYLGDIASGVHAIVEPFENNVLDHDEGYTEECDAAVYWGVKYLWHKFRDSCKAKGYDKEEPENEQRKIG